MKSISTELQTELNKNETTMTLLVKIVRKDNVTYGFTSFNKDITYGGQVYKSNSSFIPSSFMQAANLAVDNIDITGFMDDEAGIAETDLLSEFLYNAKISVFYLNYKDHSQGVVNLLYGSLGSVVILENSFLIEFRSLTYKLTRRLNNLFSKTCRAELGDTKCGVKLDATTWAADTNVSLSYEVIPSTPNGRRYRVLTPGTTGATEPSWSTTIDAEIVDNQVTWICKDEYKKDSTVLAPTKFKLVINSTPNDTPISEFKFFNTSDVRIYPTSCTGSDCANLSDINPSTYMYVTSGTSVEFTFAGEFAFKTFQIDLAAGNYITDFTLQTTYDNGTTWYNIFIMKGGTRAFWHSKSYNYLVPTSQIKFTHKSKFVTSSMYNNMAYFENGVVTWTSGKNNGLSMEVTKYDSNIVTLFKGMPYDIKPGDTFSIIAGCNHLYLGSDGTIDTGDCITRFNNGVNFRGEPFVPTEDVLVGGIGETNKEPENS